MYAKNAPLFVAAGGSAGDACTGSPAGAANAFTVGATDSNDAVSPGSSIGLCVKIFALGVGIKSTWSGSNIATKVISGSSMSMAFTTGVGALFAAQGGLDTAQAVFNKLVLECTPNVVKGNLGGANNCLLYNGGP